MKWGDQVLRTMRPSDWEAGSPVVHIFKSSLPPEEREPLEALQRALATGVAKGHVLEMSSGETVGFAFWHHLASVKTLMLVYIAMDASVRGQGIGGSFLLKSLADTRASFGEGSVEAALCEMDIPRLGPSEEERQLRARREGFYGRLGFEVLNHLYLQPPVDGVTEVPLQLAWRPLQLGVQKPSGIPEFLALVHSLYHEKYGAVTGIPVETLDRLYRVLEVECIDRQHLDLF